MAEARLAEEAPATAPADPAAGRAATRAALIAGDAAARVFAELGGTVEDPPVLMPASLPLELSGGGVRGRLCLFGGPDGEPLALRPDLTLALARSETASSNPEAAPAPAPATDPVPVTRRYRARAFRLPADGEAESGSANPSPVEFEQCGFERYGAPATAEEDADALRIVLDAARAAGARPERLAFGDLALFPAALQAMELDPAVCEALARAFRQGGGVRALLDHPPSPPGPVATRIRDLSPEDAARAVAEELERRGAPLQGLRTAAEIAQGLQQQARAARGGRALHALGDAAKARILEVAELSAPANRAAAALDALGLGAPFAGAAARFAERMVRIAPLLPARAVFAVQFGRRFTYYDGFLFEAFAAHAPDQAPFAGGGRYDGLLAALSGGRDRRTAIGGIVRPDRLAEATAAS